LGAAHGWVREHLDVSETSILLVDDQSDIRYLARAQLEIDGRFRVVAEGQDGREAVRLAAACRPELVLLDLEMPWLDGAEAVPLIQRASPASLIVVWTVAPVGVRADHATELGASIVLDKGDIYDGTLPGRLAAFLSTARSPDNHSGGSPCGRAAGP